MLEIEKKISKKNWVIENAFFFKLVYGLQNLLIVFNGGLFIFCGDADGGVHSDIESNLLNSAAIIPIETALTGRHVIMSFAWEALPIYHAVIFGVFVVVHPRLSLSQANRLQPKRVKGGIVRQPRPLHQSLFTLCAPCMVVDCAVVDSFIQLVISSLLRIYCQTRH